jgi:hypothetical protein
MFADKHGLAIRELTVSGDGEVVESIRVITQWFLQGVQEVAITFVLAVYTNF